MSILRFLTVSLVFVALNVQAKVDEVKNESDIKKTGYAIVKFYAEWCGPCKMFKPEFEELATKYSDKGSFYAVNADEQSEILQKYGVNSLPTIAILLDNKLVEKVGASELAAKLEAIKSPSKAVEAPAKQPKKVKRVMPLAKTTTKAKKSCKDCNCK